jgi:restriction system protein
LSPEGFEQAVEAHLRSYEPALKGLEITRRERLEQPDGSYEIDLVVRFEVIWVSFLVLVECKRYAGSIKRDVPMLLHGKLQSAGAHKGIVYTTSDYQKGAVLYARQHGIGLMLLQEHSFEAIVKGERPAAPKNLLLGRYVVYRPYSVLPEPDDEDTWQVSYEEAAPGFPAGA